MRPRITLPLAALGLLLAGLPAAAQVQPAADPHAGHSHGANAGPKLPDPAGGKLVVEAPSFDAGRVERGGKVTHSFTIKNTGTGPLHVDAKPG